jgi:Skp family chaperone for outer membrane proteins
MKQFTALTICALLLFAWGCSSSHKVEVAPIEVKPIHITIDVNVKIAKDLDDFFSDIDEATTQPEVKNEK